MKDPRPSLLMTGASGGLASILVDMLMDDYRLVGVDPRPMPLGRSFPGEFHHLDYTHRRIADVFRKNDFSALIHLGRVRPRPQLGPIQRFHINVEGTRNLLALAKKHGIKKIIVFSTYHVYGASPYNHAHIQEDEPLRASQMFPQLVDATELDHVSTHFMLRNPEIRTLVLRPVNVIGARIRNTISQFLRSKFCPKLMGFDPLLQFIHEHDIAQALKLCLEKDGAGIYNVAGEGAVAFSKAIELAGGMPVPIPSTMAYPFIGALQRFDLSFPRYLVDYFKYPTLISDQAFRQDFGFEPSVTTAKALSSLRWSREN